MDALYIKGEKKLSGVILGQIAKNAFIPILAGSMLCHKKVCLQNPPDIVDVQMFIKTMQELGVQVTKQNNKLYVKADTLDTWQVPKFEKRGRGLILMLGTISTRLGQVKMPYPGGCKIGDRKLDAHVEVMKGLGYKISFSRDYIRAVKTHTGSPHIHLPFPSVSATLLALLAACLALRTTTLYNPAKEPEIVDLANFLNAMGAQIEGAGSNTITIKGVAELKGTEYKTISDRIASGTFLVASALVGHNLKVKDIRLDHLQEVVATLQEANVEIRSRKEYVETWCDEIKHFNITTSVYPGFPTDLQPIFTTLASLAKGTSTIKETVYNNRFNHVNELKKLGAKIEEKKDTLIVSGVNQLTGNQVTATDIRTGASLVLAGLVAKGTTKILNASQIDRGYEQLDTKLSRVGAEIRRE